MHPLRSILHKVMFLPTKPRFLHTHFVKRHCRLCGDLMWVKNTDVKQENFVCLCFNCTHKPGSRHIEMTSIGLP